jgi:hypothetical protein
MQAAWRLATSNLSARRSRAALLIGAVTLSAALIAAVACALDSANGAIRQQLEGQIGSAELRIRPANAGGVFPIGVVELAESWPETDFAVPRARDAISVRVPLTVLEPSDDGSSWERRERTLTTDAMANGVNLETEFEIRPPTMIAGRLPRARGEIAVGAKLAERLSWSYWRANETEEALNELGVDTGYLSRPAPVVPEVVASAAEAVAVNRDIGLRVGSRVSVLRLFRSPVSFEQLEEKFGISREGLTDFMKLFRSSVTLEVVGITEPPPLGGAPQVYMGLDTLYTITGRSGVVDEVEVHLREGEYDPEAVAALHRDELDETLSLTTTEKVTSGLEKNLASSNIGFVLASVLATMSAAFIIMTGLTTGIAEQQRGLAIVRCIGGTKAQLAQAQLLTGLFVGGAGAVLGVPLGVLFAFVMVTVFKENLPTGLSVPYGMLALAGIGSLASGLIGAAYPAWRVSRMSPLRALSNRAEGVQGRSIWLVFVLSLGCLGVQAATIALPRNGDTLFWAYTTVGPAGDVRGVFPAVRAGDGGGGAGDRGAAERRAAASSPAAGANGERDAVSARVHGGGDDGGPGADDLDLDQRRERAAGLAGEDRVPRRVRERVPAAG